MVQLKVKYVGKDRNGGHTWHVLNCGEHVGYVHINSDDSFGGYFPGSDKCDDSIWKYLHEQCTSDLADAYLIDRFEEQGY